MPRIKWKDIIRFLANEYSYRKPQYLKYEIKYLKEKISVNKMETSVKMAERKGEDIGQLQRQLRKRVEVRDLRACKRDYYKSVRQQLKTRLFGLMVEFNYNTTIVLTRSDNVKALAEVRDWLVAGKIIRYKLGSSRGWDLRGLQEMANSLNIELPPVDENDPVRHRAVMQMTTREGPEG